VSARIMDSIKRFFTLEEESFASNELDSESLEPDRSRTEVPPKGYSPRHSTPMPAAPSLTRQRGNLMSVPQTKKQQIVVLEPVSMTDAKEIAENLREKKCILLNLRKTDKELSRRIVDFLNGISYAMEGSSKRVADQIYLFVPGHLEIVAAEDHDGQGGGKAEDRMSSGGGH
jgi:cell division inhibitor SepF